jgi:hypothetical protein
VLKVWHKKAKWHVGLWNNESLRSYGKKYNSKKHDSTKRKAGNCDQLEVKTNTHNIQTKKKQKKS